MADEMYSIGVTTDTWGRIDVIIYPDGGREILGRIASDPTINESIYLMAVNNFAAEHVPEKDPVKYTGYYCEGVYIKWGDWEGDLNKVREAEAAAAAEEESEEDTEE